MEYDELNYPNLEKLNYWDHKEWHKCYYKRHLAEILFYSKNPAVEIEDFLNATLRYYKRAHTDLIEHLCRLAVVYDHPEIRIVNLGIRLYEEPKNIFEYFEVLPLVILWKSDVFAYSFNFITESYSLIDDSVILPNKKTILEAAKEKLAADKDKASKQDYAYFHNYMLVYDYQMDEYINLKDNFFESHVPHVLVSKQKYYERLIRWLNKEVNGDCNSFDHKKREFLSVLILMWSGEKDNLLFFNEVVNKHTFRCKVFGKPAIYQNGKFFYMV